MKNQEVKKGLESLLQSVKRDCNENGEGCFNENGCNHEFTRQVPATGSWAKHSKFEYRQISKCSHKYCDKYKWIIDRAKHYAEKTGKTYEEIIEIWESGRGYWYMNYYQEGNQPLLNSDSIMMYDDWTNLLKERFGTNPDNWRFKCPACGHSQSVKDFSDLGVDENLAFQNCIGRHTTGVGCNWTLSGLLQIHKLTVVKDGRPVKVFEMADK